MFGGVAPMILWWYALEIDLLFCEGIFQVFGAIIVQDVQFWCVTVVLKLYGCFNPCVTNGAALAIGQGSREDGILILVVEDEDVVVTSA